jgi:hypothetical protein
MYNYIFLGCCFGEFIRRVQHVINAILFLLLVISMSNIIISYIINYNHLIINYK